MITIKGGNGTIAAGEPPDDDARPRARQLLRARQPAVPRPGRASPFTVVDRRAGSRPDAEGVVHMGPGMVITIPDDFDATGTWEFVNDDPTNVHEAAGSPRRRHDGCRRGRLGRHGFQDPPPIEGEFGSMGALGPGQRAFITLDPGEPGDYALICFVPGQDGIPHLGQAWSRRSPSSG